jgi:hypothetical protein
MRLHWELRLKHDGVLASQALANRDTPYYYNGCERWPVRRFTG